MPHTLGFSDSSDATPSPWRVCEVAHGWCAQLRKPTGQISTFLAFVQINHLHNFTKHTNFSVRCSEWDTFGSKGRSTCKPMLPPKPFTFVPTQNATCIICTRCCLPSLRCQPHKPVCAPDHHLRARGLKDAHPYFTPIQKQLLRMFSQGPTGCHGPVAVPPQRVGPWSSGALPPQPILTSVALHTGPARRPTPGKGCICRSFACCFCFATAFFCGSPSVWFFGLLWCMETRRAAVRATAHPPPRTLLPPSAWSPSLTLSSEVQCRWTPLLVVLGLFLSYGKKNNQATLQMKQKRTKGSKEMHDGPMQSS